MTRSSEAKLKTEPFHLMPGLTIYKQPKAPGKGSPNWYARMNLAVGGRKNRAYSTKTTDFHLACDRGREMFAELLIVQRGGIVPVGRSSDRQFRFDLVADAWLDNLERAAQGDKRKLHRYHDHRKIVTAPNGLAAFFRRVDIRTITAKSVNDYFEFAERASKACSLRPTTKNNHRSTLSQIFAYAIDANLLDRAPKLPTFKTRDNPRPVFTYQEYRALVDGCSGMESFYRAVGRTDLADQWGETSDFVSFMVDTFLRPSEWADLQQKHIEIVDGLYPHLKISVVRGKTRKRVAVTMPGAIETFRRILARNGRDPEAHLFMPMYANRATAMERMGDRFNEALERMQLTFDPFGRKRTTYSLRHTALMLRVLQGDNVDLLALAKNAGTSLRMLERFYCSHLQPQAKIANLQSFRADALPPPPKPLKIKTYFEQRASA